MPTVISPSVNLSGPSATASGARGRDAEQPEGSSFSAVLDRSRAASHADADDSVETAVLTPGAGRKPARAGDKKSELSAADVIAMLAPLPAAATHATASTQAGATAGTADGAADGPAADAVQRALPGEASTHAAAAQQAGTEPASTTADTATTKDDAAHDDTADAKVRVAAQASAVDPKIQAGAATSAGSPTADTDVAVTPPAAALVPQPAPAIATTTAASSAKTAPAKDAPAVVATDETPSTPQPVALESAKAPAPSAPTASADAHARDADSGAAPQPLPQLQALAAAPSDRAATPASTTPTLSVAPPVGSDEWGPAIGQQMIRMSASGHHVAELSLNPSGLGPLKVTLTMGDNQAQAMFMSAHESVRKAVEAALPQLRTTLAEQGISLGQASVGAETRQPSGQGSAFAEQNPSRPQGAYDYPGANRTDTAAAPTRLAPSPASGGRTGSGLDTFA